MFDKLRTILDKAYVDYADARYEIKKETVISFSGKELTQISSNSTDGYVIRILKCGGMSSVVFTKENNAEKAINIGLENAVMIGKRSKKPVRLANTEAVKDTFIPELKEDPRNVSSAEKLELIRKYNNIAVENEKIVGSNISYQEIIREKYFLNTEGIEIREDLVTTRLTGEIISKDGNLTQSVMVNAGGSSGFSNIRNQEENFEKCVGIAIDLLKAKPVTGGIYNCVLSPKLVGNFTHEALGHYSEADIIENLPSMRKRLKIGNKFGSEVLNIVDNATLPDQLGFYKYDDEGVKVRSTQIMKNGILTGRLHSRRTALEFGEPLSGHCVAQDYRYPPVIRMGTIFIEPGKASFEDLLNMLEDGLYLVDRMGGETAGENYTISAQYGFLVKNGKLGQMISDINMLGNLYQTLRDIVAVGNDFILRVVGSCGKGEQRNYKSCYGGSHILVKNLVVGGR